MSGRKLGGHHLESTRAKIQADRLIAWLHAIVFIEEYGHKGGMKLPDMNPETLGHRIRAALGLLSKSVPDLSAVQVTGQVTHHYVARLPEVSTNVEEWIQKFPPPPPTPTALLN